MKKAQPAQKVDWDDLKSNPAPHLANRLKRIAEGVETQEIRIKGKLHKLTPEQADYILDKLEEEQVFAPAKRKPIWKKEKKGEGGFRFLDLS